MGQCHLRLTGTRRSPLPVRAGPRAQKRRRGRTGKGRTPSERDISSVSNLRATARLRSRRRNFPTGDPRISRRVRGLRGLVLPRVMARNSFHDFAPVRALPSTNEKGSRLWLPRSVRFLLRCGPQSARSVLRRGPPRLLRCFALRPPCCFCRRLPGSGLPGVDVVRIQDDPNLLETLGQPGQVASVPHCPPELVLAASDQLPLPELARAAGRTLYHAHGPRNTVHEVEQERLCLDSERLDPVEEEAPAFEPGQELRGVVPRTGEPALERLPDQPLVGPEIGRA